MRVIKAMQESLTVLTSCHRRDLPLMVTTAVEVSTLAPSTASESSGLLTQIAD